jgi:hypothetical protein
MAREEPEKNPLEGIAENALSSFLSGLLKIKSIKVNVEFPGFTVELKSKEPPSPDLGSTPPA